MQISLACVALLLGASFAHEVASDTLEKHYRIPEARTKHISKFLCGVTCDVTCKEDGVILNIDGSYSIAYVCPNKDMFSHYNPIFILLGLCLIVSLLFFLLICFVICVSRIISKCVGTWRKYRVVHKKESTEEVSLNIVVERKDDDGIGSGTAV
ncbi:hypothetical protein PRIPAC_97400 [Pristionchus pacificus]|uniref:Uncharacterized protein n=1 Tax=Pristionchus pacificus TaxID=54126 RepID=A0A2A6BC04_PRIPA|nr:hypothetical protein PRIPAC_97400 [Pristionchus pacificus]|eukprot:PDM63396.1 hypothetical protein PRIPAC_53753 [Pristionchus pacificus]